MLSLKKQNTTNIDKKLKPVNELFLESFNSAEFYSLIKMNLHFKTLGLKITKKKTVFSLRI